MFKFSKASQRRLAEVDQMLSKVMYRALELSPVDFGITEGRRSIERQQELYASGKSQTMKSRHLVGKAVDVAAWVDGTVSWDLEYYAEINLAVQQAAEELGVEVTWGGSWRTFIDGPHFQIEDDK